MVSLTPDPLLFLHHFLGLYFPGLPIPAQGHHLSTKDEVADFLETYATRFGLPVRGGTKVFNLAREGDHYIVTADNRSFEAVHVVVASGPYQRSKIPTFSSELDPEIMQVHSSEYRNPEQLRDGDVLVVGAGNSGAEIPLELTETRPHVAFRPRYRPNTR